MIRISISNLRSISKKEIKKLNNFFNSLSDNNINLNLKNGEYPKQNQVKEISFDIDIEVEKSIDLIIIFFCFIQGVNFDKKGGWYSLKIGNYIVSFFNEKNENIKIFLK